MKKDRRLDRNLYDIISYQKRSPVSKRQKANKNRCRGHLPASPLSTALVPICRFTDIRIYQHHDTSAVDQPED
jgi:hypothetical protein